MISKLTKYAPLGDRRSYRRKLLDALLLSHSGMMRGVVVDLAGKNTGHRGNFRPPTDGVEQRIVVNLDPAVEPDVIADIRETGLDDGIADCVILAETLQHVPSPERCVAEAHRILKPGGVFIGSIPFLYPVHRDPLDLVRIGPDGLEHLLADFDDVNIYSMGNFFGVLGLFMERKVATVSSGRIMTALLVPKFLKASLLLAAKILTSLDRNPISRNEKTAVFTTGYFFTGIKR
jgi:SAM-dependent methyltransferase